MQFIQLLTQLIRILTSGQIRLSDKLRFVLLYPPMLLMLMLNNSNEKRIISIDGQRFFFLGKHFNLILNHIVNHLDFYYPLYKDASVIVDIGASFGTFPRIAKYLVPTVRVFSIEMVDESYSILEKNCQGLKGVKLLHFAVGKSTKPINYSFNPEYPEGGNLGLVSYSQTGVSEQTTLDNIIQDNKIKEISLLKIDAEGYELPILQAGSRTLSLTDWIVVEVQFENNNLISILSLMKKAGFYLNRIGAQNINSDGSIGSSDLVFKKGKHSIN